MVKINVLACFSVRVSTVSLTSSHALENELLPTNGLLKYTQNPLGFFIFFVLINPIDPLWAILQFTVHRTQQ